MKKSELRNIIREEIQRLNESKKEELELHIPISHQAGEFLNA